MIYLITFRGNSDVYYCVEKIENLFNHIKGASAWNTFVKITLIKYNGNFRDNVGIHTGIMSLTSNELKNGLIKK